MSSKSEEIKIKEHTFLWKIENLRLCTKKKGECFKSPDFRAKCLFDTSWYLNFYPRGEEESPEGYMAIDIFRCQVDNGDFKIKCDYEISVLSSEGKILRSNKSSDFFSKGYGFYWAKFWEKSIQSNDLIDVLHIRCKLKSSARSECLSSESLGVTNFDSDQSCFKWIVKNVNSNCSEVIKLPHSGSSQVEISVEAPDDDIGISIRRCEGDTKPKSVVCQMTLLDVYGKKHDTKEALHLFEKKDDSVQNDTWVFPPFLKKSKLNSEKEKYLKDDSFALRCKIDISDGSQTESIDNKESGLSPSVEHYIDASNETILEDYKRLYIDKVHSDVKLLVEDQIIKGHKSILSIRSPIFSTMFDTDMVENETGTVTISDLDAETVNLLLEYMYVGSVKKLNYEIATKLIIAADKYQVLSLKDKCAYFLKSILSHGNVCEVLIISDLVHHEVLKTATIKYIEENSECIFYSQEWNNIVERNLQLATDTFSRVSKLMAANRKKPENN